MLSRRSDTLSCGLCQDNACEYVINRNFGALMDIVIIDGLGKLIFIQITKQLVALLSVYLVDGDLRQS